MRRRLTALPPGPTPFDEREPLSRLACKAEEEEEEEEEEDEEREKEEEEEEVNCTTALFILF